LQLFLISHQLDICFLLKGPTNLPTGNKPILPMGGKVGGPQTQVGFVEKRKILALRRLGHFFLPRAVHCPVTLLTELYLLFQVTSRQ